ncbi:hypothetical protein C0989_004048 [Termitomyces sp. Mn162]|nr:hypothetical protein C0989_004048 [Termitomyces sp. Mn162]
MQRLCQELISENPSDVFQAVAAISLGDHWHLIACRSSSTQPTIYVWEKVRITQGAWHSLSLVSPIPPYYPVKHPLILDALLLFLGEVGGGLSHATEALIELSNQMQDLSLGASSLAVSVTSIKEMTSSTLQLTLTSTSQSLLRMEEMEVWLQRHIHSVEELATLSSQCSVDGVLKDLNDIGLRIHNEMDKLKFIREDCGGDGGLLEIHRELEDRIAKSLQKLDEVKVYWTEVARRGNNIPYGREYDTGEISLTVIV